MARTIKKKQYKKCKKRQKRGFLNQQDFAYAEGDTVNQDLIGLDALAPKIIKQATGQVNQIAQRHIQQIKNQGRQQVEKIAPKIMKGAITEVYKTLFRLLGRFAKKQLCSTGREIKKIFKR